MSAYWSLYQPSPRGPILLAQHLSRSFVRNYLILLSFLMQQVESSITKTNGGVTSVGPNSQFYRSNAPEGDDRYGLVMGTNGTGLSVSNTALGGQVGHGNGPGQLFHRQQSFGIQYELGNSRYYPFSRQFDNNSGGDITIAEVGWYALFYAPSDNVACVVRDLVSPLITIPSGQSRILQYTVYTTT